MIPGYMDALAKYFDLALRKSEGNVELEGVISQGRVTEAMLVRLLQYLHSVNGTMAAPVEQLDIGIQKGRDKYRIEINERDNVTSFIKGSGRFTSARVPMRVIIKNFVQGYRSLDIDACDTRINVKTETEIAKRSDELRMLDGMRGRTYRLKKRFSIVTKDALFRVDATIVRMATVTQGEGPLASGVLSAPKTYEIELEYIGNQSGARSSALLAQKMVQTAMELKMAMDGDDTYIVPSLRDAILADMKSTFGTDKFIGPMPITLERGNLIKNEYNNDCILTGYTITDKADGERCLLYMSGIADGTVFKISKSGGKIVIKNTMMSCNLSKGASVLDCEHVTQTAAGDRISEFMVFDAYSLDGEPIAHMPLLSDASDASTPSRLQKAREIVSAINAQQNKVFVKTFHDDIFKGAQEIMASYRCGKIKHHIDGLIYTPKAFAVGALFQGDIPHYGSVWEKVYKWKPPRDNSIDFLVHFVGTPLPGSTPDGLPLMQRMDLYVGADRRSVGENGRITSFEGLKALVGLATRSIAHAGYEDRQFVVEPNDESVSSTHVAVDVEAQKPKCLNGELIGHLSVVEMVRKDAKWVPLRLRQDKNHGNDVHAAMNVWRSICQPLEEDVVAGIVKLPSHMYLSDIEDTDIYYNRKQAGRSSNRAASRGIKDFHNNMVKRTLVEKLARRGKCKSVFDIACGKGNDILKYLDNDITTIVGADKSSDNIENASDGAYARAIDILNSPIKSVRRERARNGTIAFFDADFGEKMTGEHIESINDDNRRALIRMLWYGGTPPSRGAHSNSLNKYSGIVKRRFDMAACQFAIHYFMGSRQTLTAFASNLDTVLKPGGYFVGTCLDGRLVDKELRNVGGKEIRGVRGGRLVWSIKNMYGALDEDENSNYGKKIRVFMETINQPIDEYLVDFDLLVHELARKGIVALDASEYRLLGLNNYTGTFRQMYEEAQAQTHRDIMSEEEKQYSFLNRWFVFKKSTGLNSEKEAIRHKEMEPLANVGSM